MWPLTWKTRSKKTTQGDWGLFSNSVVSQSRAFLFSRIPVSLSLSKSAADMAFATNSSSFEMPEFLKVFLPFGSIGFCLRAWPRGRGSRGDAPLHGAAANGHEPTVQRLLQAKAAADAKNEDGRGLGRGLAGENGMVVRKWMNVSFDFCYPWWKMSAKTCAPACIHPLFADKTFSIYDFDYLAAFWSDHCNPKLITHFQNCSMDPDILILTCPIVW